MEVKYLLMDGSEIVAPSNSEAEFWETMRINSRFDDAATWEQYRLNFIGRLEMANGIKWHEVWKGKDIDTLVHADVRYIVAII